jgi:hypothetical protein
MRIGVHDGHIGVAESELLARGLAVCEVSRAAINIEVGCFVDEGSTLTRNRV